MQKKQKIGFLYILPALVLFFIFVAYPIVFNFYIGFHKWSGLGEPVWVGLKNYKKVFSEPVFKTVLKNFVIITGLFIILDSVFGMIIAAVVGSLAIRACLRLVHNGKFRFFAYYCFIVGIIALVANFA